MFLEAPLSVDWLGHHRVIPTSLSSVSPVCIICTGDKCHAYCSPPDTMAVSEMTLSTSAWCGLPGTLLHGPELAAQHTEELSCPQEDSVLYIHKLCSCLVIALMDTSSILSPRWQSTGLEGGMDGNPPMNIHWEEHIIQAFSPLIST